MTISIVALIAHTECRHALSFTLNGLMLNVIMLVVVKLIVVAPKSELENIFSELIYKHCLVSQTVSLV
jgi:hypothetical protein